MSRTKGISVILCTYNGATRLPSTLRALARQQIRSGLEYEVILVNNASTDNCEFVALEEWKNSGTNFILHLRRELKPGLGYARSKGILSATYSCIIFCDDDNSFYPNYAQTAYDLLNSSREIGACGGIGIPVFEGNKPLWYDEYQEAFATGPQALMPGKVNQIYGAGMAIKQEAYDHLLNMNVPPFLNGRTGSSLYSGEDTELCYRLSLSGYTIIYSDDLCFEHAISSSRLNTGYLTRLFRAFGAEGPVRELYMSYFQENYKYRLLQNWLAHLLLVCIRFIKYLIKPPKRKGRLIYFHWNLAYLKSLWKIRTQYSEYNNRIRTIAGFANPVQYIVRNPIEIIPELSNNAAVIL